MKHEIEHIPESQEVKKSKSKPKEFDPKTLLGSLMYVRYWLAFNGNDGDKPQSPYGDINF